MGVALWEERSSASLEGRRGMEGVGDGARFVFMDLFAFITFPNHPLLPLEGVVLEFGVELSLILMDRVVLYDFERMDERMCYS